MKTWAERPRHSRESYFWKLDELNRLLAINILAKEQLTTALDALDNIERSLYVISKQGYHHDLISSNCVTEVFRTIDQAMSKSFRSGDKQADQEALSLKEFEWRLGGYVQIPYNFISFMSNHSVLDRCRVTQSLDLNSYRGPEPAKLKSRQTGWSLQ